MGVFHQLVVLLDQFAPQGGAFCYALEWAWRLRLPVQGIPAPGWNNALRAGRVVHTAPHRVAVVTFSDLSPSATVEVDKASQEDACARACAQSGVYWQLSRRVENVVGGVRQQTRQDDLFVFGRALPPAQKKDLLREALREEAPAVLVCPDTWTPLSRMLVVDQGSPPSSCFLKRAAELCRRFQATPVVLTAARSEQVVRDRQRAARAVFRDCGAEADFDSVVGTPALEAAADVARWRRCQLIVTERHNDPPRRFRLWGNTAEQVLSADESSAVLSLPGHLERDFLHDGPEGGPG